MAKYYEGQEITYNYKGGTFTFKVVRSATGRLWMDRNLGAPRVATAYDDSQAYGDLFQWGRGDDGHQDKNSGMIDTLSSFDNPQHSDFIYGMGSPYDWRNPQNDNLWQGVNGINNPCPKGWRLPTATEWENERQSWSTNDMMGAYSSLLKLPVGGWRDYDSGFLMYIIGGSGHYWSSSVDGIYAGNLFFRDNDASVYKNIRADGQSVRCILDEDYELQDIDCEPLPATNIAKSSARLNGKVLSDDGKNCQARFRYKKKTDSTWITTNYFGSFITNNSFYEEITGLDSGTLYEFQCQIKHSSKESNWSYSEEFETKPYPFSKRNIELSSVNKLDSSQPIGIGVETLEDNSSRNIGVSVGEKGLHLYINHINRTKEIIVESLLKQDLINEEEDTLHFRTLKYADKGFVPEINQEVELTLDGEREFGGIIVSVEKSIKAGGIVEYDVICSDYTQHLERKLVLEKYEYDTIGNIIKNIIDKYADDFTTDNVDCDIEIKSILFNRLTIPACLDKLAQAVNYSWYVDYYKDIHFFKKGDEQAPFEITDTNGKYVQDTLVLSDELSQLRNVVVIRGSEERGEERTETYVADGFQNTFNLANKFAELPIVKINEVQQDMGVDYLDEGMDGYWSFNEKYIRFQDEPEEDDVVSIKGIPLFPVIVKATAPQSINKYGIYEFFKEDKSITSRAEAMRYAQAELGAYQNGVVEGSFLTYTAGLKSGQVIRIHSDLLGVDEEFLIQAVQFKIQAKERSEWFVKLATMRTIGIIQVLQDLIRFREIREFDPENLLTLNQFTDEIKMTDKLQDSDEWVRTSPPYKWGVDASAGLWSKSTWG